MQSDAKHERTIKLLVISVGQPDILWYTALEELVCDLTGCARSKVGI